MKFGKLIYRFIIGTVRSSNTIGHPRKSVSSEPLCAPGVLLEGQAIEIHDGDTVDVLLSGNSVRIRLAAIDCPERDQSWGNVAREELSRLIVGRTLYLETYGTDPHGRQLATIYVMQGTELINVNEQMVMRGHAWVMRLYYGCLSRSRQHQLNRLERWAKSKHVGLWKFENPIPPWQWRKTG